MTKWIEPKKITFKEKIKLLFKPMKYIKETDKNYTIILGYKEMGGKVYVVKESIIRH